VADLNALFQHSSGGTAENQENLTEGSMRPGRDSNRAPSEYR
jgi:hypothetical protein